MQRPGITSLGNVFQNLFSFLQDAGFDLEIEEFDPESFGNFTVMCSRGDVTLRARNDRGQVFIEVKLTSGQWRDKEAILQERGIRRDRFETVDGLWLGYEPDAQAEDLLVHLRLLVEAVSGGTA